MGIVNRRNAVLGWAAWRIGKRVLKKKAKDVMPGVESSSGGKGRSFGAIAGIAAAAVGALVFWRKMQNEDMPGSSSD